MISVFIGGSRRLTRLNQNVRARIDNIIEKGFTVLVGDANGADKSVQSYLAEKEYKNVVVYHSEGNCRNNLGNWSVKTVPFTGEKKGFAYYTAKDDEMLKDADFGLMIWDGKSKGTLRNILGLINIGKKTVVFLSQKQVFITISSSDKLEQLFQLCNKNLLEYFKKAFPLHKKPDHKKNQLALPSIPYA